LGRHCARIRSNPLAPTGRLDCFLKFAPRNDISLFLVPPTLWGRDERSSLLGRAHRELRERCDGWGGVFCRGTPTRRFAPPSPQVGGIRKSASSTSNFKQPDSHPHLHDLAASSLRRAKLVLSFPPTLWGGRAHRELRERCDGWGRLCLLSRYPHPALRATPERASLVSTARVGEIETADAVALLAMAARIIRSTCDPYSPDETPTPPRSRRAGRASFGCMKRI
jgi:hypothetical protein